MKNARFLNLISFIPSIFLGTQSTLFDCRDIFFFLCFSFSKLIFVMIAEITFRKRLLPWWSHVIVRLGCLCIIVNCLYFIVRMSLQSSFSLWWVQLWLQFYGKIKICYISLIWFIYYYKHAGVCLCVHLTFWILWYFHNMMIAWMVESCTHYWSACWELVCGPRPPFFWVVQAISQHHMHIRQCREVVTFLMKRMQT